MKERITAAELKAMTMKELAAWVEFNACAINRTMVMSWGHEELFKGYHIRPEYIGYKAGRLIVKAFHFTSRTRKADAQSFAEWLHWAIFGEYPAEETTEQTEETEAVTLAPAEDAQVWDENGETVTPDTDTPRHDRGGHNMKFTVTRAQYRALEGLAHWCYQAARCDIEHDAEGIEQARQTLATFPAQLDHLGIPYWVQNSVSAWAQDFRAPGNIREAYLDQALRRRGILCEGV